MRSLLPFAVAMEPAARSNHRSRIICSISDCFQNRNGTITLVPEIGAAMSGNRNILYLIIGALIVGIGVLGYNLYAVKKEPNGLQINVGPDGLKIQNK
jgi:hypothetical protein